MTTIGNLNMNSASDRSSKIQMPSTLKSSETSPSSTATGHLAHSWSRSRPNFSKTGSRRTQITTTWSSKRSKGFRSISTSQVLLCAPMHSKWMGVSRTRLSTTSRPTTISYLVYQHRATQSCKPWPSRRTWRWLARLPFSSGSPPTSKTTSTPIW